MNTLFLIRIEPGVFFHHRIIVIPSIPVRNPQIIKPFFPDLNHLLNHLSFFLIVNIFGRFHPCIKSLRQKQCFHQKDQSHQQSKQQNDQTDPSPPIPPSLEVPFHSEVIRLRKLKIFALVGSIYCCKLSSGMRMRNNRDRRHWQRIRGGSRWVIYIPVSG